MTTTYPNVTHYSEHFTRKEFNCRRCGKIPPPSVQLELVKQANALENVRTKAGRPLTINSGWRCESCNRIVGGAPKSFHRTGQATDLDCTVLDSHGRLDPKASRAEVDRIAKLAEGVPEFTSCGIGRYYDQKGFFVHVDRGSRYWRGINGV